MSVESWLGALSSGLKREKEPPLMYVVEAHDYGQHDVLGVYAIRALADDAVRRLKDSTERDTYYCVSEHRLNVATPQET